MKTTHDKYATKGDKEKLVSVGQPRKNITTYTKSDFLSPAKVGEKFKISTEEARNLMKKLKYQNASFVLNGHMSKVVVDFGNKNFLYLHPMATEAFEKHLTNQKG